MMPIPHTMPEESESSLGVARWFKGIHGQTLPLRPWDAGWGQGTGATTTATAIKWVATPLKIATVGFPVIACHERDDIRFRKMTICFKNRRRAKVLGQLETFVLRRRACLCQAYHLALHDCFQCHGWDYNDSGERTRTDINGADMAL